MVLDQLRRKKQVMKERDQLTRRELLRRGLGAAASVGALSALPRIPSVAGRSGRMPNIVFVFSDQQRRDVMSCMGHEQLHTPNFDRLASQGALCTNAVSGYPVCTPYRASLLTGRYCHSMGVAANDYRLPDTRNSFARVLKKYGYQTGYIGKWHLDGGKGRQPFIPRDRRHGFDYWVSENCNHRYFNTPTCFGDDPEPRPLPGYQPDDQTDLAIEYIREHKDHPFFLVMSWGPPHNPYIAPEEYMDMFKPEDIEQRPNVTDDMREHLAGYYAQVVNLDWNMGRLMKTLRDEGLEDDTILVFTSDHGDLIGAQGLSIREHKQRPWEESIGIPFIIRYPRRIKAGTVCDTLINTVDVMPTILSLAGAAIPSIVEGTDLSGFILGRGGRELESAFLQVLLPVSDARHLGAWRGVRTKRYTYARFEDEGWVLYDNQEDPYQLNNLIDKPEARELQKELEGELQYWLRRTGDKFEPKEVWQERFDNALLAWESD